MGIEDSKRSDAIARFIQTTGADPYMLGGLMTGSDIARYGGHVTLHSDIPVFADNADYLIGSQPSGSIYVDDNSGRRIIDSSNSGGVSGTSSGFAISSASGGASGGSGFFIDSSNAGTYVPNPSSSSGTPTDQNQGGNPSDGGQQAYTYSSFKFTLDSQGNPTFTGPVDDAHSDGKWQIQDIHLKLSEADYNKLKQSVDDARVTAGHSALYRSS